MQDTVAKTRDVSKKTGWVANLVVIHVCFALCGAWLAG